MREQIQLSSNDDIKPENINFGVTTSGTVSGKDIYYERIPITINYGNYNGPLLIKTEKCFTFGVKQNLDKETGEVNGWSLPIVMNDSKSLDDRYEPTTKQREWVEKFYEIVERCKDFLKDFLGFTEQQVKMLGNCMWWPQERENGPTLYAKIISGRSKRYDTKFRLVKDLDDHTDEGVSITKEELVENYHTIAVMRIDSLYICEKNVYLQVKVYEALLQEQEALPSLIRPPTTQPL